MSLLRVVKKFDSLLSKHQKFRIAELIVLMVIGGFLEMASVSLIFPFMSLVLDPDEMMKKSYIQVMCRVLQIYDAAAFMIFIAVALGFIFLLKNIYLLVEINIQYKFVYMNMHVMQKKLFNSLINRPYEYYLGADSGEIVRIINNDTNATFGMLVTVLQLFTELIVSAMLIVSVFIISPWITIIMAIVLVVMLMLINSVIKPILKKEGENSQTSSAGINKWLLQSIQGIKEIKVMRKEAFFEDNFNLNSKCFAQAYRRSSVLGVSSRYFIEAASMSTVFFMVAVYIFVGGSVGTIVPVLSAIALAAMRLLPSVNRVAAALAAIAYNEPMLDKLIENINNIESDGEISKSQINENEDDKGLINGMHSSIKFDHITFRYQNSESLILRDAIVSIPYGKSVGIVGASGVGKTTTVDVMLGLLTPQEGKILIDGIAISDDMGGWLAQVGYIPQFIFMLDGSIRENVVFGDDMISDEKVWHALSGASIDDFVKSLPNGLDTEIGERGVRLSGGQRQRIGIARALYHDPDVLIFDEATSALDNETESEIMESINRLHGKKTMIIIAHRLSTIENCDIVYKVEDGKIKKQIVEMGNGEEHLLQ